MIIAEIVCTACADDNNVVLPTGPNEHRVGNGLKQKADNCVCDVFGSRSRALIRPHLVNNENPRLLQFNSFDGGDSPADQFVDFLLSHGCRRTKTVVMAHNGGKFDLHLLLTALYRRNIAPILTMTGM